MSEKNKDIIDKFVGFAKAKEKSKFSWPWSLIVWALGFIVFGLALYSMYRKNRELAKLRHEKNVKDEKIIQAEVSRKVAENIDKVKEIDNEINVLSNEATMLQVSIDKRKKEAKRFKEKLKNVKNWKTIDEVFDN